jgi:hypothetical protein
MTAKERESLLHICRMRAKVAKADVATVAASRKAQFQAQSAAIYSFDQDDIWKQAHVAAAEVVHQARKQIADRARTGHTCGLCSGSRPAMVRTRRERQPGPPR